MLRPEDLKRFLLVEITKAGYTQKSFCKEIKMSQSTFFRRLQRGVFYTDEAEKIAEVLGISTDFFCKPINLIS